MTLQFRTSMPEGVSGAAYARKIGELLEQVVQDILYGVPPDKYPAAVARYAVLKELMDFAEERVAEQQKGEAPLDDDA